MIKRCSNNFNLKLVTSFYWFVNLLKTEIYAVSPSRLFVEFSQVITLHFVASVLGIIPGLNEWCVFILNSSSFMILICHTVNSQWIQGNNPPSYQLHFESRGVVCSSIKVCLWWWKPELLDFLPRPLPVFFRWELQPFIKNAVTSSGTSTN